MNYARNPRLHDMRPSASVVQDQQTYQLVDALLARSPRPASPILATAELQQHMHALKHVPARNNIKVVYDQHQAGRCTLCHTPTGVS